ncbi:UNVERIFIED_CONTAM: hypothetical protein FKN15_040036 [Acipenser sinensis]
MKMWRHLSSSATCKETRTEEYKTREYNAKPNRTIGHIAFTTVILTRFFQGLSVFKNTLVLERAH